MIKPNLRFLFASFLLATSCAQASNFDDLVENPNTVSVPQRVQLGGTCGLYALGMVMDYWHSLNSSNPTVLVSDQDLNGLGVQYNFSPTSSERILDYVSRQSFTRAGEMFVALDLAKTAAHFGYKAAYYSQASMDDIYRVLDSKHPAIVAFDVNAAGNPGLSKGMHAHYAVLERYFDYNGTRYLIAKHGRGGKKNYVWKADELFASMRNLAYTHYYSTVSDEPQGISLPAYNGRQELEDISQSLGDKLIEVVPLDENPAGGVVLTPSN